MDVEYEVKLLTSAVLTKALLVKEATGGVTVGISEETGTFFNNDLYSLNPAASKSIKLKAAISKKFWKF